MQRLPPVAPRQATAVAVIAAAGLAAATLGADWLAGAVRGQSIGPSGLTAAAVEVEGAPARVAVGPETVWALDATARRLHSVSRESGRPTGLPRRIGAPGDVVADVVATAGAAWVGLRREGAGFAVRVPADNGRRSVIPLGDAAPSRLLVGRGVIWVLGSSRVTSLPRPGSRGAARWSRAVPGAAEMAVGYGSLWVLARDPGRGAGTHVLLRIAPESGKLVGRRSIPGPGTAIVTGFGAVWVANGCPRGWLRAPVGPGPAGCHGPARGLTGIATGAEAVWAADADGSSVVRIAPDTGGAIDRLRLPRHLYAIAARGDEAWAVSRRGVLYRIVSTGSSPRGAVRDGGAA